LLSASAGADVAGAAAQAVDRAKAARPRVERIMRSFLKRVAQALKGAGAG
jgi:hypothetical protein